MHARLRYAVVAASVILSRVGVGQMANVGDGFATTPSGIRIHYLEAGRSTAAPVLVLIPGWRLPATLWSEQLRRFSAVTRVIAIDPRSQGESSKMTDGNTPEVRARDLHDVLGSLHVARYVLVGWSQGAQDVAAYVKQFDTAAVAGIVLVDSPVSAGPSEVELSRGLSEAILGGIASYAADPEAYSRGMVRSLFKQPHPDLDLEQIVRSTLKTPTNTGIAMLATDIFGADRRVALAAWTKPALVIASADSPLLDPQKAMASSIHGARFLAIPGTAHAVFVDAPQPFDDALSAFLESLPSV